MEAKQVVCKKKWYGENVEVGKVYEARLTHVHKPDRNPARYAITDEKGYNLAVWLNGKFVLGWEEVDANAKQE